MRAISITLDDSLIPVKIEQMGDNTEERALGYGELAFVFAQLTPKMMLQAAAQEAETTETGEPDPTQGLVIAQEGAMRNLPPPPSSPRRKRSGGHLLVELAVAATVAAASVALSVAQAEAFKAEGDRIMAQQEANDAAYRRLYSGMIPGRR